MPHKNLIERVREMEDGDIRKDLAKLREEFFLRRFSADPKRLDNPARYKQMRREIARYLTVLKEREAEKQPTAQGE